jgi:DegV family protein with EDD domain
MVKIVADTLSCLSSEISTRFHIPIVPQVIHFGDESFLEGIDLDADTFLQKLRSSKELPKTAAPPVELFIKIFEELVPSGEPVLCIHPSSEVSGTVRSATTAAQDFPSADIRVIDTRLIGSPLGTIVQLAAQWSEAGDDVDSIISRINEIAPRCRIYFLVDTLEYLQRGGRIGGAQALLGSLLQIKPILTFENGQVNQLEKERTHRQALERLKALVKSQYPSQAGYLSVMHAGVPEQGHALAQSLAQELGLESPVPVVNVPPAIAAHGGPGILAVAFFVSPRL